MKWPLRIVVVGTSLPYSEADGFKWSFNGGNDMRRYTPAQETARPDNQLLLPEPVYPAPTSPPELRKARLAKRQSSVPASVCGYLSHDIASPLACASGNTCIFTTFGFNWQAGCCPQTSTDCPIVTECIDSSVGTSLGTALVGVSTYVCSSSRYPICATLTYEDVPGYTIFNCGGPAVETLQAIDYSLDDTTTTSSLTRDDTPTSSSVFKPVSATTDSGSTSGDSSDRTPSAKSSVPIGPIVGGAVGGVAVISILVFGLVFLLCRRRHNANTSQNGVATAYSGAHPTVVAGASPPLQYAAQTFGQAPGGEMTDRYSVQKHHHNADIHSDYSSSVPSPGSPPTQGMGTLPVYPQSTYSPSQQEELNPHLSHQGMCTTNSFQIHKDNMPSYQEMPATRADGELRELA